MVLSSFRGGLSNFFNLKEVRETLTKIPLKSGKISQKSSFFRGGQSDFPPILGGSSIWSPYLGGVYIIATFSRGGTSGMQQF